MKAGTPARKSLLPEKPNLQTRLFAECFAPLFLRTGLPARASVCGKTAPENTFRPHDLVRCSTFTGSALKSCRVEVAEVGGTNSIIVPATEFAGEVPAAGDECVLTGNTTDTNRQSLISFEGEDTISLTQ